ncbi:putative Mg(2+) transport ATPase [compost metagenome]
MLSAYGLGEDSDPSRLVANIITAIGFVAGGVIFTIDKENKRKVSGLTTGAIIFCVASLGIGIGLGMHILVLTVVLLIELNINIAIFLKKHYNKKEKEEKMQKQIQSQINGLEHDDEDDNLDI